jgi:hypothetical protein
VVVLVPVAIGVPTVFVFVPPPVILAPATLARFMQFMALVLCLLAVPSMSLDGLMEFMIGMSDAPLAALIVLGMKSWNGGEKQRRGHYRS